jgi:hypothetical protein
MTAKDTGELVAVEYLQEIRDGNSAMAALEGL